MIPKMQKPAKAERGEAKSIASDKRAIQHSPVALSAKKHRSSRRIDNAPPMIAPIGRKSVAADAERSIVEAKATPGRIGSLDA